MAEYRRMNHLLWEKAVTPFKAHFIPDSLGLRLGYKSRRKLSLQVCISKISINSVNVNCMNTCICLQSLWALFNIYSNFKSETQDQRNVKNQNINHRCNGSPLPVSSGSLLNHDAGGRYAVKAWHFQRGTSAARQTSKCWWFMNHTKPYYALA